MNSRTKVLITGGGGYLGSQLGEKLASQGVDCYLMDRSFNAYSETLFSLMQNVHRVSVDLLDQEQLQKKCKEIAPGYIFHFAASLDRSRDFATFDQIRSINLDGLLNLLEALKEVPYAGFYFASTSDVYGTRNPLPFREDMQPEPISPYSLTKLMGEQLLRTWSTLHQKPFSIYRIFLFLGRHMPPTTFFGQLIEAIEQGKEFQMTKGRQKRDYLMLSDLLRCFTELMEVEEAVGETINLCSGISISMKEMVDNLHYRIGKEFKVNHSLPYREQEIWEIRGSNEKLKCLLPHFSPEPILSGISTLI